VLLVSGLVLAAAAGLYLGIQLADAPGRGGGDRPTDEVAGGGGHERYRPGYHYTPSEHWMNDPNGPILHDGEYHLFYQYNPEGNLWGNISWAHATSQDLVRWEEHGVAIPAERDTMIFSGSAVHDAENTTGECGDDGCLVAIYTGHRIEPETTLTRQTQDLAFSHDGGDTWVPFEGNPVIDIEQAEFRDPNVFWHEPTAHWILSVALPLERQVQLYRSPNLIDWELVSTFGPMGATDGIWECPVLLPLPVDGDQDRVRWVMKVDHNPGHVTGGSGAQYFVGDFDGTTFTAEAEHTYPRWLDHGPDFYCAMPFSGAVDEQGRHTWIAWMSNWEYASQLPTHPWRGAMTLPHSIALSDDGDTARLVRQPVGAVATLRERHWTFEEPAVEHLATRVRDDGVAGDALEIVARIDPGEADEVGLRVRVGEGESTTIGYDVDGGEVFVDRRSSGDVSFSAAFPGVYAAPVGLEDGVLDLHVFVDRSSVEVYAEGGRVMLTQLVFPSPESLGVEVYANGGTTGRAVLDVWELRPGR
jgi:fructan beta-fructosidase